MKFPKHINIAIEHNPHKSYYETADKYISDRFADGALDDRDFISAEDKEICIKSNDFWTAQWYPNTPMGFNFMVASSFDKLMDKINEEE